MKVFFDTNVLLAAYLGSGLCDEVYEHCVARHQVLVSQQVMREMKAKLTGKFKRPAVEAERALASIQAVALVLKDQAAKTKLCRDPDDDSILATALAAKADLLLSGDKDLLVLHSLKGLPILVPAAFWRFEAERA
ncbi:MAG TPA: putative toxin-antitoxin system toxin component, PIN family [bacterium]|nr:putative toxin-antitoxin system toxin component, PIN family [bacterium]